jgi:guanylate kinase
METKPKNQYNALDIDVAVAPNHDGQQLVFAIAGPSGVGKTTLLEELLEKFPELPLRRAVSFTTRPKREKEVDGIDYYFIEYDNAIELILNGEVLEFVTYDDNLYGLFKSEFEKTDGKKPIVIVDKVGIDYLRQHYDVHALIIMPPTVEELESRLRNDNRDENSIARRIKSAHSEMVDLRSLDCTRNIIVNEHVAVTIYEMKKHIEAVLANSTVRNI